MNIKQRIFKRFEIAYVELGEVDPYIINFLGRINNNPNIKTLMSCEGHYPDKERPESYSTPYISFVVNEVGWNLFWLEVATELCVGYQNNLVLGYIFFNKIQINDYIEEGIDYCSIDIYGSNNIINKPLFWEKMENAFKPFIFI